MIKQTHVRLALWLGTDVLARLFPRAIGSAKYPATKKLVVTDGDGTLYPFWNYFVPAMRSIIPVLARKFANRPDAASLKADDVEWQDEISWELARIMRLAGTHEYPWICEMSKFWQDPRWRKLWSDYAEFRAEVVEPFWRAMDAERERNLELYDDVRQGLELAQSSCEKGIVMLSDGPYYMVRAKIAQLGISHLFAAVYALHTPEPSPQYGLTAEELDFGRQRVSAFSKIPLQCPMHSNPPKWEKPSSHGLRHILNKYGVQAYEAIMVGDSRTKDGGVAQANGVDFLWARYGVELPREYRKMIEMHFVHPDHRATKAEGGDLPPMLGKHGASSWAKTLDHLIPKKKRRRRRSSACPS